MKTFQTIETKQLEKSVSTLLQDFIVPVGISRSVTAILEPQGALRTMVFGATCLAMVGLELFVAKLKRRSQNNQKRITSQSSLSRLWYHLHSRIPFSYLNGYAIWRPCP